MHRILLSTAFVALTLVGGSRAFALDDAAFCSTVTTEANDENKSAPYDIDAVTKGAGAQFDCAGKSFTSNRALSVNQGDLAAGWQDKLTAAWSQAFCADASWSEGVKGGWTVTGHYTFKDGSVYDVVAKCP
jgi:hypothetical protein